VVSYVHQLSRERLTTLRAMYLELVPEAGSRTTTASLALAGMDRDRLVAALLDARAKRGDAG
jgi:hypothetical protein